MVDAQYHTDVFALQDQRVIESLATTQWTDVFGRCERLATAASTREPQRISVPLLLGDKSIVFTYTDLAGDLPLWATPVLQSLADRWGLHCGWDSYDARPTNPQLAVELLNILSDLMEDGMAAPLITPLADGGLQGEWHRHEQDLEIVVPAESEPTYYYFNQASDEEEEGELSSNFAGVRRLIARLG